MAKFGEIDDLLVVDNVSEHMMGNVYVKYYREEDAEREFLLFRIQLYVYLYLFCLILDCHYSIKKFVTLITL